VGSRVREGILPLCPALSGSPPGVLRPALEPSAQVRPGAVGVAPEEAPAMIQGLEPPLLGGKAGRAGAVQPGEEKAVGRP